MTSRVIRWSARVVLLASAVFLLFGGPLSFWMSRIVPSASSLTALVSWITNRWWLSGMYWIIPPVVFIALAVFRGRFFCRWVCPTGTLHEAASKISLKKKLLKHRLSGYLFWIIIFSSIAGAPVFLFLDPLATFNRMTPLARGAFSVMWLIPGLVLPLLLIMAVFQPMIWCAYICPMGYLFDSVRKFWKRPSEDSFIRTRREILIGLGAGVPLGIVSAKLLSGQQSGRKPVLPPGAKDLETFSGLCSRCYACIDSCPYKIIKVGKPAGANVATWFVPELDFYHYFCYEHCNDCTGKQVCPNGAITQLTLEKKRARKIGTAKVIRPECIAWADNKDCWICGEHCSYKAIELEKNEAGVKCPVVNEELCRGCGQCQHICLIEADSKAIIVDGIDKQTSIKDKPIPPPIIPEDPFSGI